jgi:ABC-type multidrug transport system fused ATPase/permease subunit
VKSNVALGYPDASFTEEQVTTALESAHLKDFITTLPHGIHTDVGERGTKLSGGQRQRLGIARALFTNPKLLILDEATSSLDSETELNIAETIQELKGAVTVITIAHRLSTIRNADRIFYMSEGKILASGTFDQVRLAIPDFDLQARLMGL